MKRSTLAAYLCIPALFAIAVFVAVLRHTPFSAEMFLNYVVNGYLFYAAPYFLWALVVVFTKPVRLSAHSGFIASTVALMGIAAFWLLPRDPSGLPMQWLLYWPLAVILQVLFAGSSAFYLACKRASANATRPE